MFRIYIEKQILFKRHVIGGQASDRGLKSTLLLAVIVGDVRKTTIRNHNILENENRGGKEESVEQLVKSE